MDSLYRLDPPVPIDTMAGLEVDYDVAVEALAYYAVHVKPSKWGVMQQIMTQWKGLVTLLREMGLSHRGYDYPDWRQYTLLDLSAPVMVDLRSRLDWHIDFSLESAENFWTQNIELLQARDLVETLAYLRTGLDDKACEPYLDLYLGALLYTKYHLILSDSHDQLLPIYNSIYSLFMVRFRLHEIIIAESKFWQVHSTLYLWPQEIGRLDIRTFLDEESWFAYSHSIVISVIGQDK